MDIKLHKQATTTPEILADTRVAPAGMSSKYHARQFGVSVSSIQRWRQRDDVLNRPHTRHNLLPTLTSEQEEIVIAAQELLRLGLDDLLVVSREFLNPNLSRSALQLMLKRRDVPTLAQLTRQDAEENEKPKHRHRP
ncbi:hypothetical protein HHA02_11250 [Cobetia marina]|nr:hypothetical protein HHA02_11250 [Cobetia marina]